MTARRKTKRATADHLSVYGARKADAPTDPTWLGRAMTKRRATTALGKNYRLSREGRTRGRPHLPWYSI